MLCLLQLALMLACSLAALPSFYPCYRRSFDPNYADDEMDGEEEEAQDMDAEEEEE